MSFRGIGAAAAVLGIGWAIGAPGAWAFRLHNAECIDQGVDVVLADGTDPFPGARLNVRGGRVELRIERPGDPEAEPFKHIIQYEAEDQGWCHQMELPPGTRPKGQWIHRRHCLAGRELIGTGPGKVNLGTLTLERKRVTLYTEGDAPRLLEIRGVWMDDGRAPYDGEPAVRTEIRLSEGTPGTPSFKYLGGADIANEAAFRLNPSIRGPEHRRRFLVKLEPGLAYARERYCEEPRRPGAKAGPAAATASGAPPAAPASAVPTAPASRASGG